MKALLDIDIGLLKIFLQVVESNGFAAAQAALGMSASTVSAKMSDLEAALGYRLCHRGRSGFRLTPEGRTAYEAAVRLMTSLDDFCSEVSALKGRLSGEVRVGLLDNLVHDAHVPIATVLRRYFSEPNDVEINLSSGSPIDLSQKVLRGTLQFAVTSAPQRVAGLHYELVYEEENGLYCGAGHPLYSRSQTVDLAEIRRHVIVGRAHWGRRGSDLMGRRPSKAMVSDVECELELILSGHFLGLLPVAYAAPWVAKGALKRIASETVHWQVPFYIITKRGYAPSPSVTTLIAMLRESFAEARKRKPCAHPNAGRLSEA